jgi:ABC-type dipeptide/oligopeptide/nickel transport system permease component
VNQRVSWLLLSRAVQLAVVWALLSLAAFHLLWRLPAHPLDQLVQNDASATGDDVARLRHLRGLDDNPTAVWLHYWTHMPDLGRSKFDGRPVVDVLFGDTHTGRIQNTLWLTLPALLLALLLSTSMALWAAASVRVHRVMQAVSLVCSATPTFLWALLAIAVFAVRLQWLPTSGMGGVRHAVLPIAVLTVSFSAWLLRHLLPAARDAMLQPAVRTAVGMGASTSRLLALHVLPLVVPHVVPAVALLLPSLLTGALMTEVMFAYPGVGRLHMDAVLQQDPYVAVASMLAVSGMAMVSATLLDVVRR